MHRLGTLAIGAAALIAASPASADHHEEAPSPDYGAPESWLCLPSADDSCDVSLAVTDVAADGTVARAENPPADDPAFDCFYVYPTVSNDPTPNSDMTANDEERRVAVLQAAPFSQVCNVYAPLYRQITLTALRRGMAGGGWEGVDRAKAYADVSAAWHHYLDAHNDGRGVVLIGHSQGSGVLSELIAREIEGSEAADRMIAAYLIGTNVAVPPGEDVGGQFASTPACRDAEQTNCVVSFVSFRDDVPPPADSRFGRIEEDPSMSTVCVNPAAPGGGSATLDAWLSSTSLSSSAPLPPWTSDEPEVDTIYVRVPGLLSAECVSNDGFTYLSVTVNGDPSDPRTDEISGDVVVGEQRVDSWGLHLIDMNLAMGDMVTMAERQAAAWIAARAE